LQTNGLEYLENAMKDDIGDLYKIDEVLMTTNDFSDEVLEAVARIEGGASNNCGALRYRC
jgi:hypothetical protein